MKRKIILILIANFISCLLFSKEKLQVEVATQFKKLNNYACIQLPIQIMKGKYGVELSYSSGIRRPPTLPSNYSSLGISGGIGYDKLYFASCNFIRKFHLTYQKPIAYIITGVGFDIMKFNSKVDFLPHYSILSNDYYYRIETAKVIGIETFTQVGYEVNKRFKINLRVNAAFNPYKNMYGIGIGFGFNLGKI